MHLVWLIAGCFVDVCSDHVNGGPAENWDEACNDVNLLVTTIVYPEESRYEGVIGLLEKYGSSNLKNFVYSPAYVEIETNAKVVGHTDDGAEEIVRSELYNFCHIESDTNPNINCSFIVINMFDYTEKSSSLYQFQFQNGSCGQPLNIPDSAWYCFYYRYLCYVIGIGLQWLLRQNWWKSIINVLPLLLTRYFSLLVSLQETLLLLCKFWSFYCYRCCICS